MSHLKKLANDPKNVSRKLDSILTKRALLIVVFFKVNEHSFIQFCIITMFGILSNRAKVLQLHTTRNVIKLGWCIKESLASNETACTLQLFAEHQRAQLAIRYIYTGSVLYYGNAKTSSVLFELNRNLNICLSNSHSQRLYSWIFGCKASALLAVHTLELPSAVAV